MFAALNIWHVSFWLLNYRKIAEFDSRLPWIWCLLSESWSSLLKLDYDFDLLSDFINPDFDQIFKFVLNFRFGLLDARWGHSWFQMFWFFSVSFSLKKESKHLRTNQSRCAFLTADCSSSQLQQIPNKNKMPDEQEFILKWNESPLLVEILTTNKKCRAKRRGFGMSPYIQNQQSSKLR